MIICVVIAALVNPAGLISVRYVVAYIYIFLFSYVLLKVVAYNTTASREILDWTLYGVLLTSVVALLETSIDLVYNIDIGSIILQNPRARGLYGGFIPRAAAFSNEPGILAFYLETLGMIGLWVLWHRSWKLTLKVSGSIVIISSWVCTFSAASIATLLLGITIASAIKFLSSRRALRVAAVFFGTPLVVTAAVLIGLYAQDSFLGSIIMKITLHEEIGSASMRLERWQASFNRIVNNPILGIGPGTTSKMGRVSSLSWYLFIASEAGILSLSFALLFLMSKFFRMICSTIEGKYVFVSAFVAGAIHLSVISTFFHPFLWSLIILFDILEKRTPD
jgi:O-antigen ligase